MNELTTNILNKKYRVIIPARRLFAYQMFTQLWGVQCALTTASSSLDVALLMVLGFLLFCVIFSKTRILADDDQSLLTPLYFVYNFVKGIVIGFIMILIFTFL